MFSLSILMSLLFLSSFHPMSLVIIMILLIISNVLSIFFISKNIWMMVVIIMAFISGMMILFLYSSSLIPNSKFWSSINLWYLLPFMFSINFMKNMKLNDMNLMNFSIDKIYYLNWMMLLNCLIMILFMLTFVVKIIYTPYNPLKSLYEKSN